MKNFFGSTYTCYRAYKTSRLYRIYRISSYSLAGLVVVYLLILAFPQFLFAHNIKQERFDVYARQPFDENITRVLNDANERLSRSAIADDGSMSHRIFLSDTNGLYAFLSNHAYNSFANTTPFINNVMINRHDIATDSVYVNRAERNRRSLSGVIAHEVTHHFIRQKFGVVRSILFTPTWKEEGYCEYVANDGATTFEDGVRLWQESPSDDSKYRYFKHHQMVKFILDDEKLSVQELFDRDFDEKEVEARTFVKFKAN